MSNDEMSNDEIMKRMNDRAKAEGRYLGMAFWEIPREEGSILDVPMTPEAEARLAALRAERIERRKKKAAESDPVPSTGKAEKPTEYKTVQARILAYAEAIGWTYVSRCEAERRRGFDRTKTTPAEQAAEASPYFDDLLDSQVRELNPKYAEGPGALVGDLRRLHADIAGNRDFLGYLRNTKTFYDKGEGRELNLILIDYDNSENNVFEVTEEFYCHNGKHGTREDVVFLINGIPVLVIECKNATKDEAIALGVDQVRRYHAETPEMFVPQMVFTATEAIGFSYGVTWNLIRRNIFNWKNEQKGNLEAKVKSFCDRGHVLALLEGLHPLRGEGRGTPEVHPPPAPDDGRGARRGPLSVRAAEDRSAARTGVAHAGERQDFHDDQGRGAALQGGRGGQADRAGADRPQRAGRSDAAEPGDAGHQEHPARPQHRGVEQAAEGRLPRASSSRRSTSFRGCPRT